MYARVCDAKNPDGKPIIVIEGPFYAGTAIDQNHLREILKVVNNDNRGGMVIIKVYKNMTLAKAYKTSEKAFLKIYDEVCATKQTLRKKKNGMVR
jgi:hypothetical protein